LASNKIYVFQSADKERIAKHKLRCLSLMQFQFNARGTFHVNLMLEILFNEKPNRAVEWLLQFSTTVMTQTSFTKTQF
jgi:hypothetical protein